MDTDRGDESDALCPGEWIAVSHGEVVAHGRDFLEVAQEACQKAHDIVFEQVPEPDSPQPQPEPSVPGLPALVPLP